MDTKASARRFGAVAITLALALLLLALLTGHLARARALPQLVVTEAVVRLSAVPGRPAAGYFAVDGTAQVDRLIAVIAAPPTRIELHESMAMHGATTMAKLDGVDVPANGRLSFAPGGKHLMIFGLPASVKSGSSLPLTFVFAHAGKVPVKAVLRSAADAMDHTNH